jgi:hypothetical protein
MTVLSDGEVLDIRTRLYDSLRHPTPGAVRVFQQIYEYGWGQGDGHPQTRAFMFAGGIGSGIELLEAVRRPLFGADVDHVSAHIVDVVSEIYRKTMRQVSVFREADLPSRAGFAWLDKPVLLSGPDGMVPVAAAYSWGVQTVPRLGSVNHPMKGVRVTAWGDTQDPNWVSFEDGVRVRARTINMERFPYSWFFPFDVEWASRDTEHDEVRWYDVFRWVHCLWMFMGTSIVKTQPAEVPRMFRRRAQKAGLPDRVNAVMLRPVHVVRESDGTTHPVDWSCRWVVQQHPRHVRNADYAGAHEPHPAKVTGAGQPCLVCGCPTSWIEPYVKGPPGMPLRVKEVIFKVVR